MKKHLFPSIVAFLVVVSASAYAADCNSGGRYEINGAPSADGTVTDCRTGLVWLKNADCAG